MNNNMKIPFQIIDWSAIPKIEHKGESGTAFWQTVQFSGLRIRIVEYSKDYIADHWCDKGHIVHCLEGNFVIKLKDGNEYILTEGSSFIVSDGLSSHLTLSEENVKMMIIDGDFLK